MTTTTQIRRRTQRMKHVGEQVSVLQALDLLHMGLRRAHQRQLLPPSDQGFIATGRLVRRMHEQGLWTSVLALAMHRTRAEGTWCTNQEPCTDRALRMRLKAPDVRSATTAMCQDQGEEGPRRVLVHAISPHLWAGPILDLSAVDRTRLRVEEAGTGAWELADTVLAEAVTDQLVELHTLASHPAAAL
ncbi:hypothetical protein [Nocardiopsis kunsanensis]|uniref:hypothetical protein n=1 Tax=Nocardiopsis kunsanensis TaxID=141693 RepID=UPI0012687A9A|nr:hypothetical protein [Nocardiopsis kunsanensis]